MNLNFKQFIKDNLIESISLDKYYFLIRNLYKVDVSRNEEYQTKFNAFYKVRRNKKWREIFYNHFESIKNNRNIRYEDIITYLYKKTGNVEASFASKLLATINPSMPIIDQFVLQNLGEKIVGNTKDEKLKNSIDTYYKILNKENKLIEDNNIKIFISEFKEFFNKYTLSDIKVLDYYLWKNR